MNSIRDMLHNLAVQLGISNGKHGKPKTIEERVIRINISKLYKDLNDLGKKVGDCIDTINSEQHTKTAFIEPFLTILGYDISNPYEVIPEYTCDFGIKNGEKVDYAIKQRGRVVLLVEAKDCRNMLNKDNISQLFRYYSVSEAKVALLTNGVEYMFFTDTIKPNIMDCEPFLQFNITEITYDIAKQVATLFMNNFQIQSIKKVNARASYKIALRRYLRVQAHNVSGDFISFIDSQIDYEGKLTNVELQEETQDCLMEFLGELDYDKINIEFTNPKVDTTRLHKGVGSRIKGNYVLSNLNIKTVAGAKLSAILIKGYGFEISTWTQIFYSLIDYLKDEGYSENDIIKLDTTGFFKRTGNNLRVIKSNGKIYYEGNLSGVYSLRAFSSLVRCYGLQLNDIELRFV